MKGTEAESPVSTTRLYPQLAGRVRLPQLTFTDLRFLPIISLLTIIVFLDPTDPDLWWHLRTGQLILDGHRFFSSDPFSWTSASRTWYLHEWLSEVLLYWVQSNLGFIVDAAITAAVIGAALAIVYRLALRTCSREGLVLGLLVLSAVLMVPFLKVRPQAFTWLFFAVFFRQLYLSYRGERVALWPLPLLMVLWSNMHLGYLFGLMAVYVWLVALLLRDGLTGLPSLRGPVLLAIACTLAPVISPIGPRALLTPFAYVASDNTAVNSIVEWKSPDFHGVAFAPLVVAIGVLLFVGLPVGKRHLFSLLLALIAVALALIARRNIPLVALTLPIVVAESVALRWPVPSRPLRPGISWLNWAVAGLALTVTVVGVAATGTQVHSQPETPSDLPVQGVAYVRSHSLGKRMFNSYNWGGYLISQLYPKAKVSIDGRSDLYGDTILQRYLDITNVTPGWRDKLKAMDPDFIFLPNSSPLAGELLQDKDWKQAFVGRVETVFIPAK